MKSFSTDFLIRKYLFWIISFALLSVFTLVSFSGYVNASSSGGGGGGSSSSGALIYNEQIVIHPGWNVFSSPALLADILFDNDGENIDFFQYEGSSWSQNTIAPTVENIRPLEGFLIRNLNEEAVIMYLSFKETELGDILHQKTLPAGWNIIGVAHSDFGSESGISGNKIFDNFVSESFGSVVDFTEAEFSQSSFGNYLYKMVETISSSEVGNAIFSKFKSYAVFIKEDNTVYASSQMSVEAPSENITRVDFLKMVVEATTGLIDDLPDTPTFSDVPISSEDYKYIETGVMLGVVAGYRDEQGNFTGTFGPDDLATRKWVAKVVANAFGLSYVPDDCLEFPFTDVEKNNEFYYFVFNVYFSSVMDEYIAESGEFSLNDYVSKVRADQIIVHAGNPISKSCEDSTEPINVKELSIFRDNTSPYNGSVVSGTEDFTLLIADVRSPGIRVKNAQVIIDVNEGLALFAQETAVNFNEVVDNIRIVQEFEGVSGTVSQADISSSSFYEVEGTTTSNDGAFQTIITLSDDFDVPSTFASASAGTIGYLAGNNLLGVSIAQGMNWHVIIDFKDTKTGYDYANTTFQAMIAADGITDAEYLDIGGTVLPSSKKGIAVGSLFTINPSVLTLSRSDDFYERSPLLAGSKDSNVMKFDFFNDNDEEVVVDSMNINFLKGLPYLGKEDIYNVQVISEDEQIGTIGNYIEDSVENGDSYFSVALTSDPISTHIPMGEDRLDGLRVGESITFSRHIKQKGVVNNAWNWNYDNTYLDCSVYPDFDSPNLQCIVLKNGASAVSITMFPKMTDGTQEIIESNLIYVVAGGVSRDFNNSMLISDMNLVIAPKTKKTLTIQVSIFDTAELDDLDEKNSLRSLISGVTANIDKGTNLNPGKEPCNVVNTWFFNSNWTARFGNVDINKYNVSDYGSWTGRFGNIDDGRDLMMGGRLNAYQPLFGSEFIVHPLEGEVGSSALTLSRTDDLNDDDKIVVGSNNVTALEFTVNNNEGGDVTITDVFVDFNNVAPNIDNSNIRRVRLVVDGEQIGSSEDPSGTDAVTITGFEWRIPSSGQVTGKILVDISNAATIDIATKYELQAEIEGFTAFDSQNNPMAASTITAGGVTVDATNSFDGANLDIIASGLLTTTIAGTTPDSGILIAGSTDIGIARLQASAINDNMLISRIFLSNIGDSTTSTGKKATGALTDGRIAKLKLYGPIKNSSATNVLLAVTEVMVDEGIITSGDIMFDMAPGKEIYVPSDATVDLRVTVDSNSINNVTSTGQLTRIQWQAVDVISEASGDGAKQIKVVDENALTTGATALCWDLNGDYDFDDSGESNISVGSLDTDNLISITNSQDKLPAAGAWVTTYTGSTCHATEVTTVVGTPAAKLFIGRKSKPTFAHVSLGTSTLMTAHNYPIFRYKIAADSHGQVDVKRVTFEVSLEGVGTDNNFEVYDINDPYTAIPVEIELDVDGDGIYNEGIDDAYNANNSSGTGTVWSGTNIRVRATFIAAEEISAGNSLTYELRTNVYNLYASGMPSSIEEDTISVRLASDTSADVESTIGTTYSGALADINDDLDANLMIWSDNAGNGYGEITEDWWTNGYNLKPPTSYTTLSR